jgi:hypothetical protein
MFLLLYVFKRGFLDRHAGLVYAMLRAIYEYMIVLKEHELSSVMRGNEGGHEILPTRSE